MVDAEGMKTALAGTGLRLVEIELRAAGRSTRTMRFRCRPWRRSRPSPRV
jgi:hypothetical protein